MKLLFMAAAQSASIDQRTNQISVFGVVEEIGSVSFPAGGKLVLCALLSKSPREKDRRRVSLKALLRGNPEPLFTTGQVEINFEGKRRARVVADLPPFGIPGPGELDFVLTSEGRELGVWNVAVNRLPSPDQGLLTVVPGKVSSSSKVRPKKVSRRKKR